MEKFLNCWLQIFIKYFNTNSQQKRIKNKVKIFDSHGSTKSLRTPKSTSYSCHNTILPI